MVDVMMSGSGVTVLLGDEEVVIDTGEHTGVAQAAATAAALAANSALAGSRYFVSQAAGEAGSTTGQFFSHPDGAGGLVYRERTGGGSTIIAYAATTAQVNAKVATADLAASTGGGLVGMIASATGAVIRTAQDKARDWLDVRDFDLLAGGADKTAKIQSAIDAARGDFRNLKFPHGAYQIDGPLDCTDMFAGFHMFGEGSGTFNTEKITCLLCNTGEIAVDATGTENFGLRGMQLDSQNESTPSTLGLLMARSTTSQYAQHAKLDDVSIRMKHDMAANGGEGSYSLVNLAAEIHNYHNTYVIGDNPIACLATKPSWLSSPFVTIDTTLTSMSVVNCSGFLSMNGLSTTRPAFRAENLKAGKVEHVYTVGDGTVPFDLEGVEQFVVSGGSIEGQGYKVAQLKGCENIEFNLYLGGTCTGAPLIMPAAFTVNRNVMLRCDYKSGWSYLVESLNAGSVIEGFRFFLNEDLGVVATSNMPNTSNVLRPITTGLTTGGPMDIDLIRPRVLDYLRLTPITAAAAVNNSQFIDTADGKLKFKDGAGVVNATY